MSQLKEGNRQFKNGHYQEALQLIRRRFDRHALFEHPSIQRRRCAVSDGAVSQSRNVVYGIGQVLQSALRGASHYNRGNALFNEGKWADAIDAYKDSLRANPRDQDAKYNLGIALRTLKNPPPPKPGQSKADQKQGKSGQDKNQEQKQPNNNQPKSGEMSKEDAERLLAAAGAGERKKSNQKMTKGDVPHPDEDW